jgi:hypothetical protein
MTPSNQVRESVIRSFVELKSVIAYEVAQADTLVPSVQLDSVVVRQR